MEALLNFAELGALRNKARLKTSAVRPPGEAPAVAFDPRQVGQPSPTQLLGLETLHKGCAQGLGSKLSTLLRTSVEVEFASVEQISGADFLQKLPEAAYLASLGDALGSTALLQLDLALIFPILDRLLGGTGEQNAPARDLTEIEQEIFAPVSHAMVEALRQGWEPVLKIDGPGAQRVARSEAAALLSPTDKVLAVSLQLRLQETAGRLLLAFPSVISAALLRKLAPQEAPSKPSLPRDSSRLREQLLEGRFEAELLLPRSTVSIRQLCGLQPGDVVALNASAHEPLAVLIAGREMFLAAPVRCASRRGAQVQRVLSIAPPKEAEEST